MKTKEKQTKVYLAGILGCGMTSLAEYLLKMDCLVSGSDRNGLDERHYLFRYRDKMNIFHGHSEENIRKSRPNEIIYSKALNRENVELRYARENGIKTVSRPQKISDLSKGKSLVLITGTHGKSSITALVSYISSMTDQYDASYLIGAVPVDIPPSEYKQGNILILEGDESNTDILKLDPKILLISSLEWDHQETYKFKDLISLFEAILDKGSIETVIYNKSYDILSKLVNDSRIKEKISYSASFGLNADIMLDKVFPDRGFSIRDRQRKVEFQSRIYGAFNRENCIAAYSLAKKLGAEEEIIIKGTGNFNGVKKRLDLIANYGDLDLYLDYGHHPTEIRCVIKAIREKYPNKKTIIIFEPHMPSRVKNLLDDFVNALSMADAVIITEVFNARKDPFRDFTISKNLQKFQRKIEEFEFLSDFHKIDRYIDSIKGQNAVVLIISAGPLGDYIIKGHGK